MASAPPQMPVMKSRPGQEVVAGIYSGRSFTAPEVSAPRTSGSTDEPDVSYDEENGTGQDRPDLTSGSPEPEVQPVRRLVVTHGSDVRTQRWRFLWHPMIVCGGLSLIAGREGLGKSTVAVDIAAKITRGTLPGELRGTPSAVLYVASEDSRPHTIVPRFIAAGADLDRVLFLDVHTATTTEGTVVLPLDVGELEKVITEHKVVLVVLDAATSVMEARLDGHDDRKVRQFLEPLAQLAARTECSVIGICHFGKRDGGDTGKLILGSIAWSQVARSVLAVARNDDTGELVISATKANLSAESPSLSARIVSATVDTDDGPADVGRTEWLGETSDDARDLLRGQDDDGDRTERDAATTWLREYLEAGGRVKSSDAKKAASVAGFSDRTVQRARKNLRVVIADEGFPRITYWLLPDSGATDSGATDSGARAREGGTTATTGPDLRERSHSHDSGDSGDSGDSRATHGITEVNCCTVCGAPLTGATARRTNVCSRLDAAHRAARPITTTTTEETP